MSDGSSFWIHDAVSALVYSLAQPHAALDAPALQSPYNDLARFILRQQAQMPDYLQRPMRVATFGFDLLGCLRTGHRFHSGAANVREKQVRTWKNSSINFKRDFLRYYESLALL